MAPRRAFPAGPNCLQFFLSVFPRCSARVSKRERERERETAAEQRKTNGIQTKHTQLSIINFCWLFLPADFLALCHDFSTFLSMFSSWRFSFFSTSLLPLLLPLFCCLAHLIFMTFPMKTERPPYWKWGDNKYPRPRMLSSIHPPPLLPFPSASPLFPLHPPLLCESCEATTAQKQLMNKLTKNLVNISIINLCRTFVAQCS